MDRCRHSMMPAVTHLHHNDISPCLHGLSCSLEGRHHAEQLDVGLLDGACCRLPIPKAQPHGSGLQADGCLQQFLHSQMHIDMRPLCEGLRAGAQQQLSVKRAESSGHLTQALPLSLP